MDPYVYPGTSVLRNLRDIRDPELLSKFEMDMTTRRLGELARDPVPGRFDAQHLQAIHRHIFQDVYAWAGEIRTVNISRPGQFPFAFSHQVHQSLDRLSGDLEKEGYLGGNLSFPKLCSRVAHYMGELNAIHPFRDGNGRAQREFTRQLAFRNGYSLDWSRVFPDQMTEASKNSFQRGDNTGLERVLQTALDSEKNRAREQRGREGDRER